MVETEREKQERETDRQRLQEIQYHLEVANNKVYADAMLRARARSTGRVMVEFIWDDGHLKRHRFVQDTTDVYQADGTESENSVKTG